MCVICVCNSFVYSCVHYTCMYILASTHVGHTHTYVHFTLILSNILCIYHIYVTEYQGVKNNYTICSIYYILHIVYLCFIDTDPRG